MAEEKTQSAFDRFSAIGAVQQQAKSSQEQGRGGIAGGKGLSLEDFEYGYNLAKKLQEDAKAKADENKAKTDELFKNFPGGISVPKMDANFDNLVGNFLKQVRTPYAQYADVVTKGVNAEGYDTAIAEQKLIEENILQVNQDLETFAQNRVALLEDVDPNDPIKYANSTDNYQRQNLYMITSGDYDSLNPEITYDDNGKARITVLDSRGKRVNIDSMDLPKEYDPTNENTYQDLIDSTQKAKEDGLIKGEWEDSVERRRGISLIKETFKTNDDVKNYIFQAVDPKTKAPLIELYIANDLGITPEEFRKDPDYEKKIEMYKDIAFDVEEVQDLLVKSMDNKYNDSTTYEKKEKGRFKRDEEEEETDEEMTEFNNELEVEEEEESGPSRSFAPEGDIKIDKEKPNEIVIGDETYEVKDDTYTIYNGRPITKKRFFELISSKVIGNEEAKQLGAIATQISNLKFKK